jgi:hypothetical protein
MSLFDFVEDAFERAALTETYKVIKEEGVEYWLIAYTPPVNYAVDKHPVTLHLLSRLEEKGQVHSGASFCWVMNAMKYIECHGMAAFEAFYTRLTS